MRAPALSKPALEPLRPESDSSVAQDGESCPFACWKHHKPVYYRNAISADAVAATICSLCDASYTRTQLLNLYIAPGPAPDDA